jgi:hypothetical protein
MRLAQSSLDEFKQIYKDETGEEISDDVANRLGINLLELMQLILQPKDGKRNKDQGSSRGSTSTDQKPGDNQN